MTVRSASLYRRAQKLIICANARTSGGPPIDAEPFVLLAEPITSSDVGKAVVEAIKQFRELPADAPSNSDFLAFFAELAGVETYRAFMEGAAYCAIEETDGQIAFLPMVNDEGAFDPVTGSNTSEPLQVSLTAASEAVGRKALAALALAR